MWNKQLFVCALGMPQDRHEKPFKLNSFRGVKCITLHPGTQCSQTQHHLFGETLVQLRVFNFSLNKF